VGDWHGKQWVVSQGLAAGDSVIVDGVVKVRPGAPVRMAEAVPDAPAKPGRSTAILSDASGSTGPEVRKQ
jgi:membrane fusion protein (multidrug efflux system)